MIPHINKAEAIRRQRAAHPGKRIVDPVMRQSVAELERIASERTSTR